jgi:hypothetical protein
MPRRGGGVDRSIGRFFDPLLRRGWEQTIDWGKREIEKPEKATKSAA